MYTLFTRIADIEQHARLAWTCVIHGLRNNKLIAPSNRAILIFFKYVKCDKIATFLYLKYYNHTIPFWISRGIEITVNYFV